MPNTPLFMINISDDSIIMEFSSITKAAEYVNGNTGNITNCLRNNRKSAFGYKWKYKEVIYDI